MDRGQDHRPAYTEGDPLSGYHHPLPGPPCDPQRRGSPFEKRNPLHDLQRSAVFRQDGDQGRPLLSEDDRLQRRPLLYPHRQPPPPQHGKEEDGLPAGNGGGQQGVPLRHPGALSGQRNIQGNQGKAVCGADREIFRRVRRPACFRGTVRHSGRERIRDGAQDRGQPGAPGQPGGTQAVGLYL